jgi:hypothetical protein
MGDSNPRLLPNIEGVYDHLILDQKVSCEFYALGVQVAT